MAKSQLIALLPMRHESERVHGKNYRHFAGRPLFHHIVKSLLDSTMISRIVIDTDSPVILSDSFIDHPKITRLERPDQLRDGRISMNEILLHDISVVPGEYYLQTHSTNPLLTTGTINRAIDSFFSNCATSDSLFSVTPMHARLWDSRANPINHDPKVLLRTQDLQPVLIENSCLYIFGGTNLKKFSSRIGEKPLLFSISQIESWDIDTEEDFEIGECLYQYQQSKQSKEN